MTVYFDAITARKILEKGGFESKQVDSMVAAIAIAHHGELATRADIDRLNGKIDKLETRLMRGYAGGLAIFMVTTIAAMTFVSGLVSIKAS